MTDPGGMTTTEDVTQVVPYSHRDVERKLQALERDGVVESKRFGGERVWVVTGDSEDGPVRTPMPTSTRGPLAE